MIRVFGWKTRYDTVPASDDGAGWIMTTNGDVVDYPMILWNECSHRDGLYCNTWARFLT